MCTISLSGDSRLSWASAQSPLASPRVGYFVVLLRCAPAGEIAPAGGLVCESRGRRVVRSAVVVRDGVRKCGVGVEGGGCREVRNAV